MTVEPMTVEPMSAASLQLDITQAPFSRVGSYLALSLRDADVRAPWEQRPGDVLLRTVRGDRETDRVFRLDPLGLSGDVRETLPFEAEAAPHRLRLHTSGHGRDGADVSWHHALPWRGHGGADAGAGRRLRQRAAVGPGGPMAGQHEWKSR